MRSRAREQGRGERVLPGLWRLRLPLPWPGVPHGNAWVLADGDGLVLVDTGVHAEGSMTELERAMEQIGLSLDRVRRLLITHAHSDHWGQARPIVERTGCEMWVHPASRLALEQLADPDAELRRRLEVGRQSGIPEPTLQAFVARAADSPPTFAGAVHPTLDLVGGVRIATDLGDWEVHETPGHSASHVCLSQPEHRLLISGDHLLGRIVLWFDRGDRPDPVADYLRSLEVVAGLRARLALSGHGKPFLDVPGHIEGSRRAVSEALEAARGALAAGPRTAMEVTERVYGEGGVSTAAGGGGGADPAWLLPLTLCLLEHLERAGHVVRETDGALERWWPTAGDAVANLDTLVSR